MLKLTNKTLGVYLTFSCLQLTLDDYLEFHIRVETLASVFCVCELSNIGLSSNLILFIVSSEQREYSNYTTALIEI